MTPDRGICVLRWVAHQTVCGMGEHAPIVFPNAQQGQAPLLLSPNHRVMHQSSALDLLFGTSEALVTAKHMIGRAGVTRQTKPWVTYYHLMFDDHVLIRANGLLCESFYVSDTSISAMTAAMRVEFGALFPKLTWGGTPMGKMVRPPLRQWEARAAFAA